MMKSDDFIMFHHVSSCFIMFHHVSSCFIMFHHFVSRHNLVGKFSIFIQKGCDSLHLGSHFGCKSRSAGQSPFYLWEKDAQNNGYEGNENS